MLHRFDMPGLPSPTRSFLDVSAFHCHFLTGGLVLFPFLGPLSILYMNLSLLPVSSPHPA